ncbi:MAG: lipocalin-like domain-containing protein [Thermoplasmata archaeon]
MEEEKSSINKEVLLTLFIAVVILLAAVLAYFYWPEPESEDGTPTIDRSVKFPQDEGLHDEHFEVWEFFLQLETPDGKQVKVLSICEKYKDLENPRVGYQFLDMQEITGEKDFIEYTREGSVSGKEGELDMEYSSGNTFSKLRGLNDKEYEVTTGHNQFELNLSLTLEKNNILLGGSGKVYKSDFGTIFGYHQPNFKVEGDLYKGDDRLAKVNGKGWLEHTWGGDVKSLSKEEWQLQLDNSVEILITKGYDPDLKYPNDLFLHLFNIIRTDGKLMTPRLGEEVFIKYEKYKIIPADDLQKRAWSYKWVIYNDDINLTVYPSPEKSIHSWSYLGFCRVSGTYYGESVTGSGICELNKRYISEPDINKVSNNFDIFNPTDPVDIYANLTHVQPIDLDEIIVEYRVNEEEWKQIEMEYQENYWVATIPGQDYETKVEYRVSVTDLAGKTVSSSIEVYHVSES